ncbi:sigma-54 interaction domain-containing protein [Fusobacterium sp. PH5-44]|uniref:sigma-54 interaction domain-containing protein n=1 Tax=unclassified Fusobacterium TaxID=2648384 RepID=UPI003D2639D2
MIIKNGSFEEIVKHAVKNLYYAIVTDKNGLIISMSNNYLKLLNKTKEEVIGKDVIDFVPNTKIYRVIETKQEEIGELFQMADGTTLVCNRIPIFIKGVFEGVITSATFYDLKEIKKLQEKIYNLEKENQFYREQVSELNQNKFNLESIIGNSAQIKNLKNTIIKIAPSDLPVLITGETGTGKEGFANAIHHLSKRKKEKFIKINCAAIPHGLLESELFGYEKGAFSGASQSGKIGKFQLANNGSILLDEIGEMPLELQSKLLRVLQEKEIEKIGGLNNIKINVRVICATNQNLEELVEHGKFRADLYYRINSVELKIPSLRDRMEDIPMLCKHFIAKINNSMNLNIIGISDKVINLFYKHRWKGNIRELENVIERGCIMAGEDQLKIEHFDFLNLKITDNSEIHFDDNEDQTLKILKDHLEKEEIIKALTASNGNKSKAAKSIGMDRSVLYSKLKKYNILI